LGGFHFGAVRDEFPEGERGSLFSLDLAHDLWPPPPQSPVLSESVLEFEWRNLR
jgi:hypothetical protein